MSNFFESIPDSIPSEIVEVVANSEHVRIERILSGGQKSPDDFWYDQDENEWVIVLQGAARIEFEDPQRTLSLSPGDHLMIAAHQRHRIDWTCPDSVTIWLAVFFGP